MNCVCSYDRSLSETKLLRLELFTDETFQLASVSGFELIRDSRKSKKITALFTLRAELEAAISIKRRSRLRRFGEAADIMKNMIDNFLH